MGINRMSGTPWHTELFTKKEGEDRRHRSRCSYYQHSNNHCRYYFEKCRGSAHCTHYRENDDPPKPSKKAKKITAKDKPYQETRYGKNTFAPDDRINHKFHGNGTIVYIEHDTIHVRFDNGKLKTLSVRYCIDNNLIRKIRKKRDIF